MSKKSCALAPVMSDGKNSIMYTDMLTVEKVPRPLTNMIYAAYVCSNMADKMDQAGFQRNEQGEHNAKDVWKFIDGDTMVKNIGAISLIETQRGFTDRSGNRVNFTNAKEALEKAKDFNDDNTSTDKDKNTKGLVAYVSKHGDIYNVIVTEKNSRSLAIADSVNSMLQIWDVYKNAFNRIGVDIENMPDEISGIFNAYNTDIVQTLKNLKNVPVTSLYKKDALVLFSMDPNSPMVQRLVGKFGSIENAAQILDDLNHNIAATDTQGKQLLIRAVNQCKRYQGLDLDLLKQQVDQISQNIKSTSEDEAIQQTITKLHKKYGIDIKEIHRTSDKITKLSEAAAEAAMVLQRQIRDINQMQGDGAEEKRLNRILNQLLKELECKKYYHGLLNFLGEANTAVTAIDDMFQHIPVTGTELEKAVGKARILQDVKDMMQRYKLIVEALGDEKILIDENIDQFDIDNIRKTAKDISDSFAKYEKEIEDHTKTTMMTLIQEIVGSQTPDGQIVANVVNMAAADSGILDAWLYSVGRQSNVVIATMGTIIRRAQDSRDKTMNEFSLRIRRATDKLYKSDSTSEFMYEEDGHIISDIDWVLYRNARNAAYAALKSQGYNGTKLRRAMMDWEDANTEDRIVDNTNGRTERVPNYQFRKAFPTLTPTQQEYYDTMMQIKGEIGSFLPSYAQHQYLPAQKRRSTLDALARARSKEDLGKIVKLKTEDLWTIREDDTELGTAIVDGDEYNLTEGAFDNTPKRRIPIFYVNPLKDQAELLKDFSGGLQSLASTAINYDAMNNIAQVVEFIGDFAKNQLSRDEKQRGDIIGTKRFRVFKNLVKFGRNSNTEGIVDGFIAVHLYGQKLNPNKWNIKSSKFLSNVIGYTSFKALATNAKGALANYLTGEYQMLIEAGAGEFYNLKDYAWAHSKLFGFAGASGEMMELLTNNKSHKGTLFAQMFDPEQENFSEAGHTRYYKSLFRQLISTDISFLGYGAGEYMLHYTNMYAYLHHRKVLLNGKEISLYDAFELTPKQDGNAELVLKQGVTTVTGDPITQEFLDDVRRKIRGVNQVTHGAMNNEDKGLIHRHMAGRLVMNFRQWMVEHYSRRYRKAYYDSSFNEIREGYWRTAINNTLERASDAFEEGNKLKAVGLGTLDMIKFMTLDVVKFTCRVNSQWSNLTELQRYNVKRALAELQIFYGLLGLSFALGDPDRHKKEWWTRWWIYQVNRQILDAQASLPNPAMFGNFVTILNSPMGALNTWSAFAYLWGGLENGDWHETLKSGPNKGENKYWRNIKKYLFPFYKDIEQMQNLDTSDAIFSTFNTTPYQK